MNDRNLWIYSRVDGNGVRADKALQHQKQCLIEYGKGGFFSDIHVCTDLANGYSDVRPGLQNLLDAIDAGEVNAILVSEVGRLYRKPIDLFPFLLRLQRDDILLLSMQNGYVGISGLCGKFLSLMRA